MAGVSDELLMAYADGELDAAELRRVELILATDSDAMRRLRVFRSTGREIGRTLELGAFADIPERIITAIDTALAEGRAPAERQVGGTRSVEGWLAAALHRLLHEPGLPWRFAFALSFVLMLGTGLGWLLAAMSNRRHGGDVLVRMQDGQLRADGALASALERNPSGSGGRVEGSGAQPLVSPTLTFKSADGSYCRQYRVSVTTGADAEGVACREAAGDWRIVAQVAVPRQRAREGYAPAGGSSDVLIESVVDRLVTGDVLDLRTEADIMANGWRLERR